MATALRPGGLYKTAQGRYVDANGQAVSDADVQEALGTNAGGDAPAYDDMDKDDLAGLAADRNLDVTRADGKDGDPLKSDYVAALEAADASSSDAEA